jgi:hypothetical protein
MTQQPHLAEFSPTTLAVYVGNVLLATAAHHQGEPGWLVTLIGNKRDTWERVPDKDSALALLRAYWPSV